MTVKYRTAVGDGSPLWTPGNEDVDVPLNKLVEHQRDHMDKGFTVFNRTVHKAQRSNVFQLADARERMRRRAVNGPVGTVLEMRAEKDRHIELLRKVQVGAPYLNLECTEAVVDRYWQEVRTLWPNAENWGAYVYKHILGTSAWSYHAWGQALDVHASPEVMQLIANFSVKEAGKYDTIQVIYNYRSWDPDAGWVPYDGVNPHTDHVHTSHGPARNGYTTPPRCFWG